MSRYSMDIGPAVMQPPPAPPTGDADRARREREAMEALERRLAERQAMRGYIDQREPMLDEYGMPNAAALPPDPIPAARPAQPVDVLPAFDTAPGSPVGLGQAVMTSPPPQTPAAPANAGAPSPSAPPPTQAGQLAPTTPPNPAPVADTSTDPNAQTVTAGAQAAAIGGGMGASELAAPAPSPAMPQRAPGAGAGPQFAMGATGLGAPDQPVADRAAGLPSSYEQRLATAQGQDDRLDRRRNVMRILAALGAMATAKGGGGGGIFGAAGAALVRPSDNADRVRATDERDQALGTEQARRQAILDQLQQRRDAQAATERNQQQQLALRYQEMLGTQADRSLRTTIALRENEREEDLLEPASDISGRARRGFATWLRTIDPRVARTVDMSSLGSLSADDIYRLQEEMGSNANARAVGGGRSGQSGVAGGISGVENAPAAFVVAMAQANGESPTSPSETTRQAANIQWGSMRPAARAAWVATPDAQRLAQVVGRNIEGYEQTSGGAVSDEAYRAAAAANAQLQAIEADVGTAIDAINRIEAMPAGEEAITRSADVFGAEVDSAVSDYNNARSSIMGTLARMRATGVINEAEHDRFVRDMPDVSNPRQAISGTRRLQAVLESSRRLARIHMEQHGYRATAGETPTPTQRAAPSGRVTIVFTRPGGSAGRERMAVPADQVERARARMTAQGWTVHQ